MDYVDIEEDEWGLRIQARGGLQVYCFIAVPLIAVTMGLYTISEYVQRRALRSRTIQSPV